MVKVSVVTTDGKELPVSEACYYGVGDAAGDIDGGDFFANLVKEHGKIQIKEIRLILSKPIQWRED